MVLQSHNFLRQLHKAKGYPMIPVPVFFLSAFLFKDFMQLWNDRCTNLVLLQSVAEDQIMPSNDAKTAAHILLFSRTSFASWKQYNARD